MSMNCTYHVSIRVNSGIIADSQADICEEGDDSRYYWLGGQICLGKGEEWKRGMRHGIGKHGNK